MALVRIAVGLTAKYGGGPGGLNSRPGRDSLREFLPPEAHLFVHCPQKPQGALGTAPRLPRTVPVRGAWPGTKALTFCSPPHRADMLRTGTVRGPGAVSNCARWHRAHLDTTTRNFLPLTPWEPWP